MSNLYVDTVQPFSSGSLTIISASLQGLTNISSSQVLYYNTSSGEVYYDDAPAGGGGCATQVDITNYDIPDPGNYFYTNVQSTGSGCQTVNTLDQYGLYYNANTNRNISPVDLQGDLIGTASFATNALSSSYALTASYAENATSVNIYNSDGTLTGNRQVVLDGNNLTFVADSGETFEIASDPASDVLISGLPSATTSDVVYYNTASGKLTYGATPSGSGGGGGGDLYWSDGTGFAGYTGSDNLFADTGSWNYTIGNTYAYETSISASFFAAVNTSIGRTLRSAIIAGNNNKMQDNTGGFVPISVTDSILMGGTNNDIFGDAEGVYIIGGNANRAEAAGNRRSGIIGGGSNNAYAIEDSVIIGGSSNLVRSESDRTVSIGGSNNTFDFFNDNVVIGSYNNSQGTSRNNIVAIGARNFSDNMQDYNIYLGVYGSGRTFTAGTSDSVKVYVDNLNVSGSLEASGSVTVTAGQVLTLQTVDPLPTSPAIGSFAVSGSTPKPYFWDGSVWNALY